MAKLNTTVHVDGVAYGPGKDIPAEVAAQITNPDVWDGDPPTPVETPAETPVETPAANDGKPAEDSSGIPPKGGAGSGKDAWLVYAEGKVEVPEGATRDEIVAALEAAGIPTE
jgi:hypothetical protein